MGNPVSGTCDTTCQETELEYKRFWNEEESPQAGMEELVSLEGFFGEWGTSHARHIGELRQLLVSGSHDEAHLLRLIQTVLEDYKDYYAAKRRAVQEDVFQVLNPVFKSSLETAFMWMGGWRPTAAVQMVLSQIALAASSVDVRKDFVRLRGVTSEQVGQIKEEKEKITVREDCIMSKAAELQKSIVSGNVIKIAQGLEYIDATIAAAKLQGLMKGKVVELCGIFLEADELRYESLVSILGILTPVQAAQYLVTAEVLRVAFTHVGEIKEKKAAAASC